MNLQPWQIAAGVFTSSGMGGVVSSAFAWLGKRQRSQAYTMGAVDHAVQTAMASVTGQLERTEDRLEIMETQHAECERNLRSVRTDLDDSKREIERLMARPAAGPYTEISRPVRDHE